MRPLLLALACWTLSATAAPSRPKLEPPIPIRTVAPDYPAALRRVGLSGLVTVRCRIDEAGNVVATQIEKSSHSGFEGPAMAALQQWKFRPARQGGRPTAIAVSIPVEFVAGN